MLRDIIYLHHFLQVNWGTSQSWSRGVSTMSWRRSTSGPRKTPRSLPASFTPCSSLIQPNVPQPKRACPTPGSTHDECRLLKPPPPQPVCLAFSSSSLCETVQPHLVLIDISPSIVWTVFFYVFLFVYYLAFVQTRRWTFCLERKVDCNLSLCQHALDSAQWSKGTSWAFHTWKQAHGSMTSTHEIFLPCQIIPMIRFSSLLFLNLSSFVSSFLSTYSL